MTERGQHQFADQHGIAVDVRSWLYADAWLRGPAQRQYPGLPVPALPFYYREVKRAPYGEPGLYLPLSCAIAFDFDSGGAVTATSWSHTMSATAGGVLIVGAFDDTGGSNLLTAVNWNTSEGLTKIAQVQEPSGRWVSLWYLLNPTSGVHNVSLTTTAGSFKGSAISLTGVAALDVSGTGTQAAGVTVSDNITVAANAWIASVVKESFAGSPTWTNATERSNTVASGLHMADSNAALTGSQTTTFSWSGSTTAAIVSASFTVSGGGGGGSNWGPWIVGNNWNRIVQGQ